MEEGGEVGTEAQEEKVLPVVDAAAAAAPEAGLPVAAANWLLPAVPGGSALAAV